MTANWIETTIRFFLFILATIYYRYAFGKHLPAALITKNIPISQTAVFWICRDFGVIRSCTVTDAPLLECSQSQHNNSQSVLNLYLSTAQINLTHCNDVPQIS